MLVLILPFAFATPFIRPRLFPFGGKIVGGLPITIQDASYQISLQTRNFHICGGSVISENFVLTAAHCTSGQSASSLTIRAGSDLYRSGGVVVRVEKILQHEKFDYSKIDFDFSLLKLAAPLNFSDLIQPIALPSQDEIVEDDSLCIVTGWGNTQNSQESRDKLRAAYVPSVNQAECDAAYRNFGGITDRMICAGYKSGGKDACQGLLLERRLLRRFLNYLFTGDSGGPLVSGEKLVGVVSWGYGCAIAGYPGVYSRVAAARDWIKEKSGV